MRQRGVEFENRAVGYMPHSGRYGAFPGCHNHFPLSLLYRAIIQRINHNKPIRRKALCSLKNLRYWNYSEVISIYECIAKPYAIRD